MAIDHSNNLLKLSLSQSKYDQKNTLQRVIEFLDTFFISRFLSVNSIVIKNEISKEVKNSQYYNYLNKINKRVNFIINTKFINSEIIILYCYCPMAIGLLKYFRSEFKNEKYIVLLDDGVNNSSTIHETKLMQPSVFLESIDNLGLPLRYKSIDVVICHLHEFIHKKISKEFTSKLLNIMPASTNINVVSFQNLFT
jgi:hypothetical protein